ncbi:MAG TPA: hypothetical protein VFS60_00355 [Thermoanaerobaculia bacterium]|nr:hypothetical protein [Thermoanaerobaculia bacterium]
MPPPNNLGLLPSGWPFYPGVDPSSGVVITPPRTALSPLEFRWTVPSGKWWLPLYWLTVGQAGAGGPPNETSFQVVLASNYFGHGQNPGLENSLIARVGVAAPGGQNVHLSLGVFAGDLTFVPGAVGSPAYASAALVPALMGPGDQADLLYRDTANTPPGTVNFVAAEFDSGGSSDGTDQPFVATPILA